MKNKTYNINGFNELMEINLTIFITSLITRIIQKKQTYYVHPDCVAHEADDSVERAGVLNL